MAYLREGIDAHVREFFDKRFHSSFIQRNPLLYFLGMRSAEGRGELGQPGASAVLGGMDLGEAEVDDMLGSKERFHTYQKEEPNDGARVSFGGATPTASGFAEDNAGQIAFRWTHYKEPMKVRKHSLKFAKGESAIGSILDRASGPVWNRFLKRINTLLWHGGTASNGSTYNMNTAAKQGAEVWDEPLGLVYSVGTQSNIFGRVDRSSETLLNPFQINSATAFTTTLVDLDVNRLVNNGYVNQANSTAVDGLANKNPNGMGCNLFITTSALFNELAAQADARGINQITGGLPNHSVTGFRYPVIEHDNVYYTWDKDCPSGTMYCLDLDTFLMEVDGSANFTWTGFTDKEKTEEGGGAYEWGNYEVMFRGPQCMKPWLNGTITNLTTS